MNGYDPSSDDDSELLRGLGLAEPRPTRAAEIIPETTVNTMAAGMAWSCAEPDDDGQDATLAAPVLPPMPRPLELAWSWGVAVVAAAGILTVCVMVAFDLARELPAKLSRTTTVAAVTTTTTTTQPVQYVLTIPDPVTTTPAATTTPTAKPLIDPDTRFLGLLIYPPADPAAAIRLAHKACTLLAANSSHQAVTNQLTADAPFDAVNWTKILDIVSAANQVYCPQN
ncbi:DUF732 domain-containing protein [Mycobacterium paragordonae]|uniref:DUF732 domain-containing protein n=1 Tax=Mycobacterium paragordonae TaxID=1389713 RepID=UPI0012E150D9|nr:DUF732 domain-containing protein [Mycobacterium paragordonae]